MYKVYFDNRFIVISGHADRLQNYCLFHKFHDLDGLYERINYFIENPEIKSMNIYSYKINKLWDSFKAFFELRKAAGGILTDSESRFLFIKRYGRWDIPKGHMEKDETIEECAIREIEEETGLKAGNMRAVLSPTYHTYDSGKNLILKKTYWFIFNLARHGEPSPQLLEGITEVRWFERKDLNTIHTNTWASITQIIHEVFLKLLHDEGSQIL